MTAPVYVFGDVHGFYDKLTARLIEAELIDDAHHWIGDDAVLWFIGDFTDRGPHGIEVIDLVMRLQAEARSAGGAVNSLLGNHDLSLLAAYHFGETRTTGPGGNFLTDWKRVGGQMNDLDNLTPAHIHWLNSLPPMARVEGRLFAHADSILYLRYGKSVEEVSEAFLSILYSEEPSVWERLISEFSEHKAFTGRDHGGTTRAAQFLAQFGGAQIVHGHSPIATLTGQAPIAVDQALVYAGGQCVDVDGGLYLGGGGFLYRLPPLIV
jgi:hypothetical protein